MVYNALLVVIVLFYFIRAIPHQKRPSNSMPSSGLFLSSVLANIAYCAAYVADVFAEWSSYRDFPRRYRSFMLVAGMLFAGILTRLFSLGMFFPGGSDIQP